MSHSLYFDDKEYISSKRASEIASYSRDYVGQLARQGVISAKLVGRVWYVSKDDILRHALTYDLNHRNISNLSDDDVERFRSSLNSEIRKDGLSVKNENSNFKSIKKDDLFRDGNSSNLLENDSNLIQNENESREDIHRSKIELRDEINHDGNLQLSQIKDVEVGNLNNALPESLHPRARSGVEEMIGDYVRRNDGSLNKTAFIYEEDNRSLLPKLSGRDTALNKAISDDDKTIKDENIDDTIKSDEIRSIIHKKKRLWAQKSKRFFEDNFVSKLSQFKNKTTVGFAGVVVAFLILISASYLSNNFSAISSDFKNDFSINSLDEYTASIGSFFSNSWSQLKVATGDLVCKVFVCEKTKVEIVKIPHDDSKTTIVNVSKSVVESTKPFTISNLNTIDSSQISNLKMQIQTLNDRLDNQKVFSMYQSDRNMENVGKTTSNIYDSIVTLIDQRLAGVSSGGTFSSDVTVGGILTVSGGSTSSFANSLSVGGQFTLLGTGTSTIAGDVNFDSGVLYVDSLNNRIGIGTTSPLSVLDIYGGMILSRENSYLNFGPVAGTGGYGFRDNSGIIEYKTLGGSWLPVGSGGGGGADGNWTYFNGSGIRLSTSTNAVLIGANSTTTTSKLEVIGSTYISSTLGIGTTSPWRTLSVKGSSDLGNNALAGSFIATSSVSSVFPYASSTAYTVSQNLYLSNLNGPLQANNGLVSATTSVGVYYGGTGATGFGQGWIYSNGGTGALSASTSPTVAYIYATSTNATSTFASGIQTTLLKVIGTISSSTFANGIDLSSGCFAIGGVCVGGSNLTGSGSQNKLAYWTSASNVSFSNNLNWIESVARLGIGTTTPNWNLQIASSSGATITLSDTSASANSKHWSISSIGGNFMIGTTSDNLTSTSSYLSFDSQNYGTYVGKDTGGVNSNAPDYAQYNTFVGYGAGRGPSSWISDDNTAVGALALYKINTAYNNTALGFQSLYNNVDGDQNIAIGYNVGPNIVNGSNNILIGSNINAQNDNGMLLNIGNIIFGNNVDGYLDTISSGNIGVGSSSPFARFSVSGNAGGTTNVFAVSTSTAGYATSTAFIIDSNGKVGIGTTSPYAQLSVTGTIAATGLTLSGITGSTQCLRVNSAGVVSGTGVDCSSGGASYDWLQQTNAFAVNSLTPTTTLPIWIKSTATSTFAGGIESWDKIGAPYFIATSTTDTSTFFGGLSVQGNKLIVQSLSGNVGISNTNPSYNLDVTGTINVSQILRLNGSTAINTVNASTLAVGNSSSWSTISYGPLSKFNIFSSGNVGIGTTTPYAKLSVMGSDIATTTFAIYGYSSQTAPLMLVASTTDSATSTAFIIDSNGKVGIGTTSPYAQLSVTGTIAATGLTLSGITGSTQCLRVDDSGTVSGTGADCGSSSGASYDWLQQTNAFAVNSLTPTTTLPIWIKSTATSTFAGGIESWDKIGAPYFIATSTTATSTFFGGLKVGTSTAGLNVLQNGMVGIGTSTPLGVFSVHATQGGQVPLFVVASSTNGGATSTAFYIAPNGTIGVGTAPVSGYQLTSTGAIRATQLYGISQITSPNYLMLNPGTVNSYASVSGSIYASNSGGTYPFNSTMNLIISPQTGGGTARDIVFAVGSTTVSTMVVQGSTYNVGIGTTSPFAKLSVYGNNVSSTTVAIYGYSSQTAPLLLIASTTASATSTAFIIDSNGKVGIGTTSPYAQLSVTGTIAATGLTLSGITGSTQCLRVDASGTVSGTGADCGTSSGAAYDWLQQTNAFAVNSLTPTTTLPIWIQSTATSTFAGGIESWTKIGAPYFIATSTTATSTFAGGVNVAGTTGFSVFPGGNVTIGTASPGANDKVTISGQVTINTDTPIVANSGSSSGFRISSYTSRLVQNYLMLYGKGRVTGTNTGTWQFNDGTIDTVSFLTGGNVGIGTTSPFAKLSVYGSSAATTTFSLYGYSSQTANIMYVATTTGSATSTAFVIDSLGEVGIATSSPWRTLSVVGTIAAPNLTVAGTSGSAICLAAGGEVQVNSGAQTCTVSSARFKHNIESQVSGLETIRALRPVSFKYNNDASEQVRLGLIAEEVKDVDPRLIFKGEDNLPRGVRYEDLTSVLTKAVQELDTKVSETSSTTLKLVNNTETDKTQFDIKFVQYDSEIKLIHDQINQMGIQLNAFNASTTASTTALILEEDTSFIGKIFEKVKDYISKVSDWVVNKISAALGVFDRVETKTASVSNGIEMLDQATGEMYCVQIKAGEFVKGKGNCANQATSTPVNTQNNIVPNPIIESKNTNQQNNVGVDQSTSTQNIEVSTSTTNISSSNNSSTVTSNTNTATTTDSVNTQNITPKTSGSNSSTNSSSNESGSVNTVTTSNESTSTNAPTSKSESTPASTINSASVSTPESSSSSTSQPAPVTTPTQVSTPEPISAPVSTPAQASEPAPAPAPASDTSQTGTN